MNIQGIIAALLLGGMFIAFLIFQLIQTHREDKELDEQIRKAKINAK